MAIKYLTASSKTTHDTTNVKQGLPVRGIVEEPKGLGYKAGFLNATEEMKLLEFVRNLSVVPVAFHGNKPKRLVRHFGVRYDYVSGRLEEGEPIPAQLVPIIKKMQTFAGLKPDRIINALICKYEAGASTGWLNDVTHYDSVISVSLLAPCILQFRRGQGAERRVCERLINPRAVLVLQGEANDSWEHKVPEVKEVRYSVTLRCLRV